MPSSTSLDIYLNHQVGDQIPNEQSNQSDACSLSHSRTPHISTPCSMVENMTKPTNLSANLSIKGDTVLSSWQFFFSHEVEEIFNLQGSVFTMQTDWIVLYKYVN